MSIQDYFQQLKELKDVILQMQLDFIKHTVMVSSALLALLISLNPLLVGNKWLFLSILVLLLLCILLGIIVLYLALIQLRKMDKDFRAGISKHIDTGEKLTIGDTVFAKNTLLLQIFEKLCFLSFALACILLVVFAFFKYL